MIQLRLSPSECWQYDTAIAVSPTNVGLSISALEFGFEFGRGYRVALSNGKAVIPQILMEQYGRLLVCAVNSSNDVIAAGAIRMHRRPKPAEYVASDEYGDVTDIIGSIAARWAQANGDRLFAPLLSEARSEFAHYVSDAQQHLSAANQLLDEASEVIEEAQRASADAHAAADAVMAQVNSLWFEVDAEDGGLNAIIH